LIPIYHSLSRIAPCTRRAVVSIGNFDGVHRGHQQILGAVVEEARRSNARAIAFTFDPHPEHFLRPTKAPKLLTPIAERLRLLEQTGIDAVVILPFDRTLAAMSARVFVERILVHHLCVRSLHEGTNFRFGYRAGAGITELRSFGAELGFDVHVHDAVHVHGLEVSSSAIRTAVAQGDMKRARWMLGRPFNVLSSPKRDRGVGAELLVPTVNLAPYHGQLPAAGVYVTQLRIAGRCFNGVTNVGNRPTFEGAGFSVETHLLNFEPVEMNDETPLELTFLYRLRGEQKWPSPAALKAQITKDVARAQKYFRLIPA
jgi:riboflavin kinase / FMN adenylyltransferase